jgi:hypothetical protein
MCLLYTVLYLLCYCLHVHTVLYLYTGYGTVCMDILYFTYILYLVPSRFTKLYISTVVLSTPSNVYTLHCTYCSAIYMYILYCTYVCIAYSTVYMYILYCIYVLYIVPSTCTILYISTVALSTHICKCVYFTLYLLQYCLHIHIVTYLYIV